MTFPDSNFGQTLFTTTISALISIVGFCVTIYVMRRSFKEEIEKQKSDNSLSKMSSIPYDILHLYERIVAPASLDRIVEAMGLVGKAKHEYEEQVKKEYRDAIVQMKELYNTIYAYGSKKAIRILAELQKCNYKSVNENDPDKSGKTVAYYILLATQIRFDVTGEVISPKLWYEINITDYEERGAVY